MSKTNEHPKFAVKMDRRLLTEHDGARHLLVDVKAPQIEPTGADERPPLDLALVIDASGSMDGEPLDAAPSVPAGLPRLHA
jgi:hypothetical protein